MSEPVFRKRFAEEEAWGREYSRNRYLRFETRVDVNQRYQDLMKNITILTDTDKVDVTGEKHCNRPLEYDGFYLSKKSGAVYGDVMDKTYGQSPLRNLMISGTEKPAAARANITERIKASWLGGIAKNC